MAEKLSERIGTFTPDLDDRRRLAVTEALMIAEKNNGNLFLGDFGTCVLHNAIENNDDDVIALSDSTTRRLNQIAMGLG